MRVPRLPLGLACLSLFFGFVPRAKAQTDSNWESGLKQYASYNAGNIDNVSTSNGALSVDIPLISYPQQGGKIGLQFALHYNNSGSVASGYCWGPEPTECATGSSGLQHGWQFIIRNYPTASIGQYVVFPSDYINTMSISTGDGAKHQFALTTYSPFGINNWESVDESGYRINDPNNDYYGNEMTIIDANGLQYNGEGGLSGWPITALEYFLSVPLPATVQDTNGNAVTASVSGGLISNWTDTVGRSISTPQPVSGNPDCPGSDAEVAWNPPGYAGGTYPIEFCFSLVTEEDPLGNGMIPPGPGGTYTAGNLTKVILPDGSSWSFQYSNDPSYPYSNDLQQITFPTGGTLSYTWYTPSQSGFYNCDPASTNYYFLRAVQSRTLDSNTPYDATDPGAGVSGTWSYDYSNLTSPNWYTTVTNPTVGSVISSSIHRFTFPLAIGCSPYENEADYNQGSSTLKTVKTSYTSNNPDAAAFGYVALNVEPTSVQTIWSGGTEYQNIPTYDTSAATTVPRFDIMTNALVGTAFSSTYGRLMSSVDYDYPSGTAWIRTTSYNYQAFVNSSYLTANLLTLPSTVQVTGVGPGSLTNYGYDSTGGVHGNQTSVQQWINTTGGYATTNYTFDGNGRVTTTLDPNMHSTTCSYGSGYAGTGPTSCSNALSQTTNYGYDFNTGLLTSTQDPNGNSTTNTYDSSLRYVYINYPDGGQTNFGYPNPNQVEIAKKIDTRWTFSTVLVDGVGRQVRTAVSNDQGVPYDQEDLCYDAMGRVSFETVPFQGWGFFARSCPEIFSAPGDFVVYDGLGRVISQTHSDDGSIITTSYSANETTVTDEQGKTRETTTDGVGRLASVIEDPSGLNQLTTYSYDALDNLGGVTQTGSRTRSFTYDSLSRLVSATNPESGTTGYNYDANGNVTTRTDALGITTTYSYDALNRVTEKSYSDGTPTVGFYYDMPSVWGNAITNPIGRLTLTLIGSVTTADIFSYDPMGRVNYRWQCVPGVCGWRFAYGYDFIGDMASYSVLNGLISFSQTFNTAGRPTSLTSSFNDSMHPPNLVTPPSGTPVQYNSTGAVTYEQLGNGLVNQTVFNARPQPCRINVSSSATALSSCTGAAPSGNVVDFQMGYEPTAVTNADNGNIMSWSATGAQNFNRNYTPYDGVNRLSTMSDSYSGATCTALSFTYDAWGNRWQTPAGGTCPSWNPASYTSANQPVPTGGSYTFDADGRMTYDGTNAYFYDAENHIIQVGGGSLGNCSSAIACYVYDANGRRVEKTAGGVSTLYLHDLNGNVQLEMIGGGYTLSNEYVYFNNSLAAVYAGGTSGEALFVHPDHLGSTRLVTDYTGCIVDNLDYFPFGELTNLTPLCPMIDISHKFTGKERDDETNLDNSIARYYASAMGRFMSPDPENAGADPTNPQSWNMYSYVLNSPLTFLDPTGRECVWDDGSFDAEDDPDTGNAGDCQNQGGTWIELGQNGNWSNQSNTTLQGIVSGIQNGSISSVMVTTPDGSQYTTDYNGSGQTTETITPSGSTLYSYATRPTSSSPFSAGLGVAAVGEGACIIFEPCGAGEVTGAAAFGVLFSISQRLIDLSIHFAKGGTQNILPSWAEGERPRSGESATDFARRLCDARYGAGNYDKGPTSEYSKIRKWARDKFGI